MPDYSCSYVSHSSKAEQTFVIAASILNAAVIVNVVVVVVVAVIVFVLPLSLSGCNTLKVIYSAHTRPF